MIDSTVLSDFMKDMAMFIAGCTATVLLAGIVGALVFRDPSQTEESPASDDPHSQRPPREDIHAAA